MRILLVEDEIFLANSTAKKLIKEHIKVDIEYDGEKALQMILNNNYDLVVLDIMLPKIDGLTIIKKVREHKDSIPIILTSTKGTTEDKVKGLEVGADDYLTKPYEFIELLARINTNLRRIDDSFIFNTNSFGDLVLNRNSLSLEKGESVLSLTFKEFDLLEYLINVSPNSLSKEMILDKVWASSADALPSHVEVYISYIRKKLKLLESNVEIVTIRGIGYKIEVKK